ncbi:MAG: hypothetical protein JWO43_77 [Candidatus Adlerbacteria bacterium]|nr:hypothetical protein [Candidatus Adlerbacteria bacterium]
MKSVKKALIGAVSALALAFGISSHMAPAKAADISLGLMISNQTTVGTKQIAKATANAATYDNGFNNNTADAVSTALNAGNVLNGTFNATSGPANWDLGVAAAGAIATQSSKVGSQVATAMSSATSQLSATANATALNAGNVATVVGNASTVAH